MSLNAKTFFLVFLLAIIGSGCATLPGGAPDGSLPAPELIAPPDKSRGYSDSRTMASHSLTAKGYERLEKGDVDGALRLLEKAVGINPSDGPGYYYLAEAWMAKGNYGQAERFNKLAEIYLRRDRYWAGQARDQKRRINRKKIGE
ncbi:tetratricopeptide repeat protein [Desulfoluna butyratoxydans]|uniref:Tetratricopeptide repeat n=1 Tax=Desulfoluna butyratoxydans TaxID=231438 RepID=A0A4U8YR84_9BACT|nr:tetratricopeptide repeat protein [Desulfoluna butyratoxydans]VFQ46855.1 tetratricopeptide repeat [Desulfoluna butyratoxydans]